MDRLRACARRGQGRSRAAVATLWVLMRRPHVLTGAILAAALLASGCATAPSQATSPAAPSGGLHTRLAATVDSLIDAPPLHRTSWGILVQDAATGTVLYARNAERHFIPASNMKLVLAASALGTLGPDYRYRTALWTAPLEGTQGVRLVVTGSGDPTWSARFHGSVAAPFDSVAVAVVNGGISQVAELVIDASRFTDDGVHPTWEVSDLPTLFAPPVEAFAAAEATFRLALGGGAAPGTAGIATVVPPLHQPIRATITTDTAGAPTVVRTDYTARRDTIYVSGRIAAGGADTLTLAVTRPAESAAAALAATLARHGVTVGGVRVVRDPAEAAALRSGTTPVGAVLSPPMSAIVEGILRPSQNWMSEQVSKTMGAELAGEGSWAAGQGAQRAWLVNVVGLDSLALNLRDASGMSAQNLLTPAATLALLLHVRGQPWGPAFRQALPQPGLAGSTLAGRLQGLEGRVFAKTGTISNVNALSGYFVASDGREFVFSILSNGSGLPAARVRAAMDEVVRALARHPDGR
jgi:serine-type D-Ala-D-Ala carboxypeptidase/endopeptidase (penicillin-binding protein 4)